MWLRVSMKVFDLHVVGVTFVMLYFGFMPHKCPIRHQCQTKDSDDYHTDEHSNKNHCFVWVFGFLGLRVCVLGLGACGFRLLGFRLGCVFGRGLGLGFFFGQYITFVTAIKKILDTNMPSMKIIAEFGSLKKP